ncbi:MAG: PssD/Cps14F family polysaccharide biosynthesis glycosyltransferase [Coprobacillaceae bacterium]
MKTGIVVLNYNDAVETKNFINKISDYHVVDHICVVDNGSDDDSLQQLKRIRKKEVTLISLVNNKGYASGNNAGLKFLYEQNCDLCIIANPDTEIDSKNLQDFISFVKSYSEYDVFGPVIKEFGTINRGWKLPRLFTDILSNLVLINRLFKNKIKYSSSHYRGPISEVDCVSGCFFGITRNAIEKIGYLDEETFLYYEENILGKKMKDANLKSCILNHVEIHHNHSVTIDKTINKYQKLRVLKNSQYYYQKTYFKHSKLGLWLLKVTATFACFIARIRTDKKVLRKNTGKKKKVTILSLHMKIGGIEKAISSLANMLIDTYDVEIINVYKLVEEPAFKLDERIKVTYLSTALKPNKKEFKEAIAYKDIKNIIKEGMKSFHVLYQKRKLIKKAAKDCNGDIIVSSTLAFDRPFSKYQKDKVLVAWEHCHPNNSKNYVKKVQKAVKKFDVMIPSSEALYRYYNERITGPKCMYVPLAIDDIPKDKASLNTNQITVMGRLSKEKAYDDMLNVFKIVLEKNSKAILNIVGDGEERESLKKLASDLQIENQVVFHGNLTGEEKEQVLLNTSVFVTSSHYESFGLVLLEAMSYGIPCVSFTSAEGSLEIIDTNINGYLIEGRDYNEMVNKISVLLEKTTKTMQNNAIKKARLYTYKNVKDKWLEAFTVFSKGDIKKRVIFTSSAGGHYSELCELQELMDTYNSFLLTEDHEMMEEYKKHNKARSWYLRPGTKEHLLKFLWNFPFNIINSFRVYWKVKPDVIIATGAHTTVPICYIAKLFRKKVIFIETFANITTKTLSGKLVYPIADLFLVQWEEMLAL